MGNATVNTDAFGECRNNEWQNSEFAGKCYKYFKKCGGNTNEKEI